MPHKIEDLKPCIATVQVDNEQVRVTRYTFPPGTDTGWLLEVSDAAEQFQVAAITFRITGRPFGHVAK